MEIHIPLVEERNKAFAAQFATDPYGAVHKLAKVILHWHFASGAVEAGILLGIEHYGLHPDVPHYIAADWNGGQCDETTKLMVASLVRYWLVERIRRGGLSNYNDAIDYINRSMQSVATIEGFLARQICAAHLENVIYMEVRGAPYQHTRGGLSLSQVMEAMVAAVVKAPIPVKLGWCALRHNPVAEAEKAALCEEGVDLLLDPRYRDHWRFLDLAGKEETYSGVPKWWLEQAARARAGGAVLTAHMWETKKPEPADLVALNSIGGVDRYGHALHAIAANGEAIELLKSLQGGRTLEICPIANVWTNAVPATESHHVRYEDKTIEIPGIGAHPIGHASNSDYWKITISPDGTLTPSRGVSDNLVALVFDHGFTLEQLYWVNRNALEAAACSAEEKLLVRTRLDESYWGGN